MRGKSDTLPTYLPARFRTGYAWRIDRRCAAAREIAADLTELWQDLGGVDMLSAQQRTLAERVVFLRRQLLEHETGVLQGQKGLLEPNEYSAALNSLVGLLKALGIARRARTVSFADYVASNVPETAQDALAGSPSADVGAAP